MEPRRAIYEATNAELYLGSEQDRSYDVGCPDQNQERGRPHPHIQAELQRGYLRKLRYEHRWSQHSCMLV